MVLTGGPGCGKTSVVQTIVKLWGAQGKLVRICAPTGAAEGGLLGAFVGGCEEVVGRGAGVALFGPGPRHKEAAAVLAVLCRRCFLGGCAQQVYQIYICRALTLHPPR